MDSNTKQFKITPSISLHTCKTCGYNSQASITPSNNNLDLHKEIEQLNARLHYVKAQRSTNETAAMEASSTANNERLRLIDEQCRLKDRYDRLYESHKRMQKVNHNLEEKLLFAVEKLNSNTHILQNCINLLNQKILDGNHIINDLENECEEYRKDCNIASGLLQCNPSNFVSHKISTLPLDLQERVRLYMTSEEQFMLDSRAKEEFKETVIPIPTFPPTAMMYALPMGAPTLHTSSSSSNMDSVPSRLLAKVLSKPSRRKHIKTIQPSKLSHDISLSSFHDDQQIQLRINGELLGTDAMCNTHDILDSTRMDIDCDNKCSTHINGYIESPSLPIIDSMSTHISSTQNKSQISCDIHKIGAVFDL